MKIIGIISDTHGYLDERIIHHLKECDLILHAGDIGSFAVIEGLLNVAPVRAVYGNIDGAEYRRSFELNSIMEIEGLKILMTHIAGRPGKYPTRVKQLINKEKPDIFICGHSHICLFAKNPVDKVIHINPGAAGRHGFHKTRTLVRIRLDAGKLLEPEIVELGPRTT